MRGANPVRRTSGAHSADPAKVLLDRSWRASVGRRVTVLRDAGQQRGTAPTVAQGAAPTTLADRTFTSTGAGSCVAGRTQWPPPMPNLRWRAASSFCMPLTLVLPPRDPMAVAAAGGREETGRDAQVGVRRADAHIGLQGRAAAHGIAAGVDVDGPSRPGQEGGQRRDRRSRDGPAHVTVRGGARTLVHGSSSCVDAGRSPCRIGAHGVPVARAFAVAHNHTSGRPACPCWLGQTDGPRRTAAQPQAACRCGRDQGAHHTPPPSWQALQRVRAFESPAMRAAAAGAETATTTPWRLLRSAQGAGRPVLRVLLSMPCNPGDSLEQARRAREC